MTEIEIEGEAQSYTTPVESLDFAHLGKYFSNPRAEKIPLWSKKKMDGDHDYCQAQIGSQDNINEDCYTEEAIEATTCHICSVEVPVICYKEHTESEQHVALENIFQNVLERLSKQMKTTVIINDSSINKDKEYFCAPCSKIIKVENKLTHETSPCHARSQKELSIVKEFNKIFKKENVANSDDVQAVQNEEVEEVGCEIVDVESFLSGSNMDLESIHFNNIIYDITDGITPDKFTEDCINTAGSSNEHTTRPTTEENLESSPVEEDFFEEMIRKYSFELYDFIQDFRRRNVDEDSSLSGNNNTENIQNNDINKSVSDVTHQEESNDNINAACSSIKPTDEPSSDENLVSSSFEEYYFKEMARKYDLDVVLPIIDGDFVRVNNPSGITVKVLRENFHSYEFLCKTRGILYCQMCKKWFNAEDKSKHKISEKHARNIFIPVSDQFARVFCYNSSHCLICNKVVLTSLWQHHLDSEHHVRTLNSSVLADICQSSEETNVGTENEIEQMGSEHVQESEKHKEVEDNIDSDDDEEQTASAPLTNEEHVDKSEENNSKVSDESEDELDDLPSYLCHLYSDENDIDTAEDISSDQKLVYCKPCNISVAENRILHHNAGLKHRNNVIIKILTVIAEGLKAYFSEDQRKPSGSSEKQKDGTENESANSQEKANTDENSGDHGEANRNDHANDNKSASKDDKAINCANKDESTNNNDGAINHDNSASKSVSNSDVTPPDPFMFALNYESSKHGEANKEKRANKNYHKTKKEIANKNCHANDTKSASKKYNATNRKKYWYASKPVSYDDLEIPDPKIFALYYEPSKHGEAKEDKKANKNDSATKNENANFSKNSCKNHDNSASTSTSYDDIIPSDPLMFALYYERKSNIRPSSVCDIDNNIDNA